MENFVLEICVDSLESALTADQAGATRLEVCADLMLGGTTPTLSLVRAAKRETGMPVHAMLRPRYGDFLYTDLEYSLMLEDAQALLDAGADALVCGILLPDGSLDGERLHRLVDMAHAAGKKFTLNRAFDLCVNPMGMLEVCWKLGVDIVLTSGQSASCLGGLGLLRKLWEKNRGSGMELLIGAGVSAKSLPRILTEIPDANAFHMSGRQAKESPMRYKKPGVSMGLPGISEFQIWQADEAKIKAAREVLLQA